MNKNLLFQATNFKTQNTNLKEKENKNGQQKNTQNF